MVRPAQWTAARKGGKLAAGGGMTETTVLEIALILALGLLAQWAAWRYQVPAIVLLALAGLAAGPGLGLVDPARDFGPLLQPAVAVAVAVILFEGGLGLDLRSLRDAAVAVRRLVIAGAPLAWLLGALAGHTLAGLSWPVAIILGGILVVTGPTVIAPLLRQARLAQRPAAVLRWEGIVNDPLGALFAVIAYEVVVTLEAEGSLAAAAGLMLAGAVAAAVLGVLAGLGAARAFRRGLVPEFLKAPMLLGLILACFAVSNAIHEETGLLAVTALGMTVGNARIATIEELRRFKENVATVLVTAVFVLLTATLEWSHLRALDARHALFLAAILFLVRPLAVLLSTLGSGLPWRERALVAWVAPRGIVAVAVAGLFAGKLVEHGYPDGALLVPLSFAVVFATVLAHGFSIRPLARALGLVATERPGVLIVGASPWTAALAKALNELEVPATVVDSVWYRLRIARHEGVPTYYGEILSDVTHHHLAFAAFDHLVAATGNDAYNALVCSNLAPEFGRANVYQTGCLEEEEHPRRLPFTIGGRPLLTSCALGDDLDRRIRAGWRFRKTRLTDDFDYAALTARLPQDAEPVLALSTDGRLTFAPDLERNEPGPGDVVVTFGPGGDAARERSPSEVT